MQKEPLPAMLSSSPIAHGYRLWEVTSVGPQISEEVRDYKAQPGEEEAGLLARVGEEAGLGGVRDAVARVQVNYQAGRITFVRLILTPKGEECR